MADDAGAADFDVALMGWGTRGVDQITVEQLRALACARDIVVDPGAPPSIFEMLRAYSAPIHDLRAVYADGRQKRDVYPEMTAAVLALAEKRGRTVWMTYGHPLVYSMPSQILVRECRARGLRLRVLSGISSIAEIESVLGLDIAERDFTIVLASHLVSRRHAIDPGVDLLIMQPGALGERSLLRDPELRRRRDVSAYRALQEHLEQFYPPEHLYTSVCLSDEPGVPNEVVEAPISRIAELAPEMHYGQTWLVRALADVTPRRVVDGAVSGAPAAIARITEEAQSAGLFYGSDARTGALLRTLAATKPGGALLELGTGIGLGAAWLLDGMDARARLTSVDLQEAGGIARRCLGHDTRLELHIGDAGAFLRGLSGRRFDLVFADAPPGKLVDLELALDALAPGGLYVADDMAPELHGSERRAELGALSSALAARRELVLTGLPWGTGLLVAARRP